MPYTDEGEWYPHPSDWTEKVVAKATEFKAVEVVPGILYVVEVETGKYEAHVAKKPIVPLPHGSKLVATFEATFPDAASSKVMIPVEEL